MQQILDVTKEKMGKSIDSLNSSLTTIRSGRANPTILDRVSIEYYGSMTPINQVASIQVVEGRQLLIKAFDKSTLKAIDHAISLADLGLVPQNDGEVIRINIPALNEERRKELSKSAHKMGEEAKVIVRNIRRDSNDSIKKNDEFTEDTRKQAQDKVQKITDDFIKKIDQIVEAKAKEIMSV